MGSVKLSREDWLELPETIVLTRRFPVEWVDTCIRVLKYRDGLPQEKKDRLDELVKQMPDIGNCGKDEKTEKPIRQEIHDILSTPVPSPTREDISAAAREGFYGRKET